MFIKVVISDTVLLHPEDLPRDSGTGELDKLLEKTLKEKYELKLIHDTGLCLKVVGFQSKLPKVLLGTADLAVDLSLTCLVYSSFEGEVCRGFVIRSDEKGVVVKMQKVEVLILQKFMNPDSYFSEEGSWIWPSKEPAYDFKLSIGDEVYFKTAVINKSKLTYHKLFEDSDQTLMHSYFILGRINEVGLGNTKWWGLS